MIFINKDSINNIVLTLTERSKLINPYFVFQFTSDYSRNEVIFHADDLSTFKCRYNRFNITESGSTYVNLTGGTVNLLPIGTWTYNVFESTTPTLSLSATTGCVLETGKVYVADNINLI